MVTRAFSPFEGPHRGLLTTARGTPRVWMVSGTGGSCGSQCGLLAAGCPPGGHPGIHSIAYTVLGHPRGAVTPFALTTKGASIGYDSHAWLFRSLLKKKKAVCRMASIPRTLEILPKKNVNSWANP